MNRFVDGISGPLRDMMGQGNNVENLEAIFRDTNATSEAVVDGAALEKIDDTTENVIPQARDREVISQVNVDGVGMLAAQCNSGSVIVSMNRTITDKSTQPLYDGSRLHVDCRRVDGDWRISDVTPI